MSQLHPYNPDLSYHFINVSLVCEVQPSWENDEPNHDGLENIFAIPRGYYNEPFIADDDMDGSALYEDIHGYVRDHYDLIGAIRVGKDIIPDYVQMDEEQWSWNELDSFETIFNVMNTYSRRLSESISNTMRYSFSNLLMGYALRSKQDGHGLIALRGTVSVDEWLNNMNYQLVPFHPSNPQFGHVHKGFRDIYKGIRGRFYQLVDHFEPDVPLYIVGHSLGGALAKFAALDLTKREPKRTNQIQVYTYAAPRAGDVTFARVYDSSVKTSYRIVNVCDVVPYVPFDKLGDFLNQTPSPYADTKGELAYVHQSGNPITNHISSYHIAIKQRIPTSSSTKQPRPFSDQHF